MINETINKVQTSTTNSTTPVVALSDADINLEMANYYILGASKLLPGTQDRRRILCKAIHYLNNELKAEA